VCGVQLADRFQFHDRTPGHDQIESLSTEEDATVRDGYLDLT